VCQHDADAGTTTPTASGPTTAAGTATTAGPAGALSCHPGSASATQPTDRAGTTWTSVTAGTPISCSDRGARDGERPVARDYPERTAAAPTALATIAALATGPTTATTATAREDQRAAASSTPTAATTVSTNATRATVCRDVIDASHSAERTAAIPQAAVCPWLAGAARTTVGAYRTTNATGAAHGGPAATDCAGAAASQLSAAAIAARERTQPRSRIEIQATDA
jgi:hypothetical protein